MREERGLGKGWEGKRRQATMEGCTAEVREVVTKDKSSPWGTRGALPFSESVPLQLSFSLW